MIKTPDFVYILYSQLPIPIFKTIQGWNFGLNEANRCAVGVLYPSDIPHPM